jgi:hypothetical protein
MFSIRFYLHLFLNLSVILECSLITIAYLAFGAFDFSQIKYGRRRYRSLVILYCEVISTILVLSLL